MHAAIAGELHPRRQARIDEARRVLDPVFMHLADPKWLVRGQFLRNYYVAGW